jgi:tellurite resistance-related uncharacterized protein
MDREIAAFHLDEAGDWVAELSYGHNQHVRHRPPFQQRGWVVDDHARAARVGTALQCPLCDRAELPTSVRRRRTTPRWTGATVPAALRRRHRLSANTWGRLDVHGGSVLFHMDADPSWERTLRVGDGQVIPPEVDHWIVPGPNTELSITFFEVDRFPEPR